MNPSPSSTAMYCRTCGYALVGLSEHRCPECGREFDPAVPHTYLRSCRAWRVRRWVRRLTIMAGCLVGLVLIGAGVPLATLHWQWRAEQAIIAPLKRSMYYVTTVPLREPWQRKVFHALFDNGLPPHESGWLGSLFIRLTERTTAVELTSTSGNCRLDARTLASLAGLKALRALELREVAIRDDDLAGVEEVRQLTSLTLMTLPITDVALEHVRRLPALEKLDVHCEGITDAGMAHIGRILTLRTLCLGTPLVTGEGLANLAGLPNLSELYIWSPRVTTLMHVREIRSLTSLSLFGCSIADAELAHLQSLPSLTTLYLGKVPITDAAADYILALPALKAVQISLTRMSDAGEAKLFPLTTNYLRESVRATDSTRAQQTRPAPMP